MIYAKHQGQNFRRAINLRPKPLQDLGLLLRVDLQAKLEKNQILLPLIHADER